MLGGVIVVLAVGYFNAPHAEAPRLSHLPAPTKPLFKPEPALLLSDARLRLTPAQKGRIEATAQKWQRRKAELLAGMNEFAPQQGRVDEIRAKLADYSQLSRDYDATRARYWTKALAVLTPSQAKEVQP